jgi:hypothetical protein
MIKASSFMSLPVCLLAKLATAVSHRFSKQQSQTDVSIDKRNLLEYSLSPLCPSESLFVSLSLCVFVSNPTIVIIRGHSKFD